MKEKWLVGSINLVLGVSLSFAISIVNIALAATIEYGTTLYESDLSDTDYTDTGIAPSPIPSEMEPSPAEVIHSESGAWPIFIRVPSNTEAGVRYNHTMPAGTYRLEIYSPEDLPTDDYYPNYVWDTLSRSPFQWIGGRVCVYKNKPIERGAYPYLTINYDYKFPDYFGPWGEYPDGVGKKTAADAARGSYFDVELEWGDYLILVMYDARDYYRWQNRGNVTLRIIPPSNYVYLDPGHGKDPITWEYRRGCSVYDDYEDDLNLKIATELYSKFPEEYKVDMTRFSEFDLESSERDSLIKRVEMANKKFNDLVDNLYQQGISPRSKAEEEAKKRMVFVSIHCNADGPTTHGTETYYSWENPEPARSLTLASSTLDELVKLNLKNRDVRIKDWYVIAKTKMPACLVEVAFFTNSEPDLDQTWLDIEALRLHQPEFRESAAEAIKNGTINYFKFWEE